MLLKCHFIQSALLFSGNSCWFSDEEMACRNCLPDSSHHMASWNINWPPRIISIRLILIDMLNIAITVLVVTLFSHLDHHDHYRRHHHHHHQSASSSLLLKSSGNHHTSHPPSVWGRWEGARRSPCHWGRAVRSRHHLGGSNQGVGPLIISKVWVNISRLAVELIKWIHTASTSISHTYIHCRGFSDRWDDVGHYALPYLHPNMVILGYSGQLLATVFLQQSAQKFEIGS